MYSEKETLHYRAEKDEAFRTEDESPIPRSDRAHFGGLRYYPPSPTFVVPTRLVPEAPTRRVTMPTNAGDEHTYFVAGHLQFRLDGNQGRLTAYRSDASDPDVFVPFRDATAPKETYGAGRYLDFPAQPNLPVLLDFNLAYNPFCAYSDDFSCALPPRENWLPFPIRAGERNYRDP